MIERYINKAPCALITTLKEQIAVREAQNRAMQKAIDRITAGPPKDDPKKA